MLIVHVVKRIWNFESNRGHRVRAVVRGLGWQIQKRLTKQPRDIRVFGDMTLRCYPDSHGAGLMIYSGGWFDYDDMYFVQRYLQPGDVFLDVGANIGVYSLLAASRIGDTGKVISFEAGRRAFERLNENIALNGLDFVDARYAAVSSTNGTISFMQGQRDLVNKIVVDSTKNGSAACDEVPSVTLDSAVGEMRMSLGKIDIEGAEPIAFGAAEGLLRDGNPPVWLIELKDQLLQEFGQSAEVFARWLRDRDYLLANYDADRNELAFPEEPWHDQENVIAIFRPALEGVKERLRC